MAITLPPTDTMIVNICETYRKATPDDVAEGTVWYRAAYAIACRLDPSNPRRAAGILAVFSANTKWRQNVSLAERLYATGVAPGHLATDKAQMIFDGAHPDSVVSGDKIIPFFRSIMGEDAPAVIDRHAFDIACGVRYGDDARPLGKRNMRACQDAYARAAAILDVPVYVCQAVTWVVWRKGLTTRRTATNGQTVADIAG